MTLEEPERPIPNSYWVVPGRFAAGEYPGDLDASKATAKVMALLSAGVDHFVDLTEPGELLPYVNIARDEATSLGADFAHDRLPVRDLSVPRSPGGMTGILDAIDTALDDGKTVYLHCWGGVGPTGTVAGYWLVRHGRTGDEALEQLAEWSRGSRRCTVSRSHRGCLSSPDTSVAGRAQPRRETSRHGHHTGSIPRLPARPSCGRRTRHHAGVQIARHL